MPVSLNQQVFKFLVTAGWKINLKSIFHFVGESIAFGETKAPQTVSPHQTYLEKKKLWKHQA